MPILKNLRIKNCENLTNPYKECNTILIETSNHSDKNYACIKDKKYLNFIYIKNFLDYYKKNINTCLEIEFENNIIMHPDFIKIAKLLNNYDFIDKILIYNLIDNNIIDYIKLLNEFNSILSNKNVCVRFNINPGSHLTKQEESSLILFIKNNIKMNYYFYYFFNFDFNNNFNLDYLKDLKNNNIINEFNHNSIGFIKDQLFDITLYKDKLNEFLELYNNNINSDNLYKIIDTGNKINIFSSLDIILESKNVFKNMKCKSFEQFWRLTLDGVIDTICNRYNRKEYLMISEKNFKSFLNDIIDKNVTCIENKCDTNILLDYKKYLLNE